MRTIVLAISACCAMVTPTLGGSISGTYIGLSDGTEINLTAGSVDWVKWGAEGESGTGWSTVRKSGVTPIINSTLTPLGTPPSGFNVELAAFSGEEHLKFSWTDGDSPMTGMSDTVVTETLVPAATSYPVGLGAAMTAQASATTRVMDVYVQGFNADRMLIRAALSGGASVGTLVLSNQQPANNPNNNFSWGRYRLEFAGVGETLTVSVETTGATATGAQNAFFNAGIFAAVIVPEPAALWMLFAATPMAWRRMR